MASSVPTLGALLRGVRNREGWTLKQMSEKSGIPVSTLSKVEHDRLTLTYDKLYQVAQRLGMRMSELFAELNDETPAAVMAPRKPVGSARGNPQLRLLLPMHGSPAEADDPGHLEDSSEDAGRVWRAGPPCGRGVRLRPERPGDGPHPR